MTDRERVIKGLEHCSEDGCKECPYEQDCTMADGFSELASDALTLLKEQKKRNEPMEPTLNESHCYVSDAFKCGKCGHAIRFHAKYCEDCGQAVKWGE